MKKLKIRFDFRGFTLVEIILAVVVTGFLSLMALQLLSQMKTQEKTVTQKIEKNAGIELAQQIIRRDVQSVTPSFNIFTNFENSDRHPNQSFFDFLEDDVCNETDPSCRREVILTPGQGSFILLTRAVQSVSGPPVFYDPARAYNITKDPSGKTVLNFVSLNKDHYLTQELGVQFFNPNQLILLQAPMSFVPPDGVPPHTPSKIVSFLASVKNALNVERVIVKLDNGIDLIPTRHPSCKNSQSKQNLDITSVDLFLRCLPPVSSSSSFALLSPVQLVKYEIKKSQLVRYVWDGSGFPSQGVVLAERVSSVSFLRNNISSTLVSFNVNIDTK